MADAMVSGGGGDRRAALITGSSSGIGRRPEAAAETSLTCSSVRCGPGSTRVTRIPKGRSLVAQGLIYRAATFPHPRLRWPVGPTSFVAGRLRAFCPDRLYELLMRIAFRIRAP